MIAIINRLTIYQYKVCTIKNVVNKNTLKQKEHAFMSYFRSKSSGILMRVVPGVVTATLLASSIEHTQTQLLDVVWLLKLKVRKSWTR
jgi:hypothetical protein